MDQGIAIGDLLRVSGLAHLDKDSAPDALEAALREFARHFDQLDEVKKAVGREAAIKFLRDAGLKGPARLVEAALGEAAGGERAGAGGAQQGRALVIADPEPWPEPAEGVEVVAKLVETARRFVAMSDHDAVACALWVLHTHALDAAEISPRLGVTAPQRRCGKTTLLHILGALVARPLSSANITPAAMFRTIESARPTLLVDEADTFLDKSDELRGVLNAGHNRRAATIIRNVAIGNDYEPRQFSVWAPVAIALIGSLPSTLEDRSVVITLRRRKEDERVDPARFDRLDRLEPLRRMAWSWAQGSLETLRAADPDVPAELHDRAADNWRPLLAIADAVGGEWPERARAAAVYFSARDNAEDSEPAVILLSDIRALYLEKGEDKLWSSEIVEALVKREDRPWPEWKAGRPITTRQLARLLAPFGVRPTKVRKGSQTFQGYRLEDFDDAFLRYLPVEPERPEQAMAGAVNRPDAIRNTPSSVPDREAGGEPHHAYDVPEVPVVPHHQEEGDDPLLFACTDAGVIYDE